MGHTQLPQQQHLQQETRPDQLDVMLFALMMLYSGMNCNLATQQQCMTDDIAVHISAQHVTSVVDKMHQLWQRHFCPGAIAHRRLHILD